MAQVKWTATAKSELADIVYYIAVKDRRREVAKAIYHEITAQCQLYADNPELGRPRPDLCVQPGDRFRSFTH